MTSRIGKIGIAATAVALLIAAGVFLPDDESLPLIVGTSSFSVSKLPVFIALDQDLFAKHGLEIEAWLPTGDGGSKVHGSLATRLWRMTGINMPSEPEISVDGATPMMVGVTQNRPAPHEVTVGATDCVVRAHVIGRKGIATLADLKGKRIGVSSLRATSGFHALFLAQRMGWDPLHDVAILADAGDVDALRDGAVDAIVGYETELAEVEREGFPILLDMREWDGAIAGNSFKADPEWLKDPAHREATRRFLMAVGEAIALFHQRPALAVDIMERWYGLDRAEAEIFYARGAWIPQKPYPCIEGLKKTMVLYDSNEMRRYRAEDFYDDSIVREIDRSGFFDGLYANAISQADVDARPAIGGP